MDLALAITPQPGQQARNFFGGIAQCHQHVGAECRIIGVLFGIGGEQRKLAGEVLDVMHDESHAAVEFVKPAGIHQRLLAGLLGQIACQLLPGDLEKVEILPVEPSFYPRTGQHNRPDQGDRNGSAGPRPQASSASVSHSGTCAISP